MKNIVTFSILVFTAGGILLFIFGLSSKQTPKSQVISASVTNTALSLTDVNKHSSSQSCWMAINGTVYDVTNYISDHPGGRRILLGCGKDATNMFNSIHSALAKNILRKFAVGQLAS